jgi:ABC-2 type transport system permease protein
MEHTKYFWIARINLINSFVYVREMIAKSAFIGVIVFIFIQLWKAIYGPNNIIEGYTINMMLWYFVMAESIVTSQSRVLEEIGNDVISGNIANYLNKPYNYILYKFSESIGKAIVRFSLTFIIGAIVVGVLLGGISIGISSILLITVSVFLAITLHFCMMAFLGIFALWIEDPRALSFVYSKIIFTIGGMLIPLEIFPFWLQSISAKLPFSYIAYYPSKLFVNFSTELFLRTAILQLVWIAIITIVIVISYNIHIKKLTINGG